MPRIPDGALSQIVYLYPSVEDAEAGARLGGSGFLVTLPSVVIPETGVLFAVTNAHVIEDGNTVIRLNTTDGKFDTFDFSEGEWCLHDDRDDLAICGMPLLDRTRHQFAEIGPDTFLKRYEVDAFNIGPHLPNIAKYKVCNVYIVTQQVLRRIVAASAHLNS